MSETVYGVQVIPDDWDRIIWRSHYLRLTEAIATAREVDAEALSLARFYISEAESSAQAWHGNHREGILLLARALLGARGKDAGTAATAERHMGIGDESGEAVPSGQRSDPGGRAATPEKEGSTPSGPTLPHSAGTETPRTDEFYRLHPIDEYEQMKLNDPDSGAAWLDFARQLERELAEARAALVFSAFHQHATPLHQLPKGVRLIDGNRVIVTLPDGREVDTAPPAERK